MAPAFRPPARTNFAAMMEDADEDDDDEEDADRDNDEEVDELLCPTLHRLVKRAAAKTCDSCEGKEECHWHCRSCSFSYCTFCASAGAGTLSLDELYASALDRVSYTASASSSAADDNDDEDDVEDDTTDEEVEDEKDESDDLHEVPSADTEQLKALDLSRLIPVLRIAWHKKNPGKRVFECPGGASCNFLCFSLADAWDFTDSSKPVTDWLRRHGAEAWCLGVADRLGMDVRQFLYVLCTIVGASGWCAMQLGSLCESELQRLALVLRQSGVAWEPCQSCQCSLMGEVNEDLSCQVGLLCRWLRHPSPRLGDWVLDCVHSGSCSSCATGSSVAEQLRWHCKTCAKADGHDSICDVCARGCHLGHDLVPLGRQAFSCCCGSEGCPPKGCQHDSGLPLGSLAAQLPRRHRCGNLLGELLRKGTERLKLRRLVLHLALLRLMKRAKPAVQRTTLELLCQAIEKCEAWHRSSTADWQPAGGILQIVIDFL